MAEPVLSVRNLSKSFGALTATDDVSLDVLPGQIHALIGPNGAGKSTLIAQISGALRPDAGQVLLGGRDITVLSVAARARLGLGRSFQVSSVLPEFTVRENIAVALAGRERLAHRLWAPWSGRADLGAEAETHAARTNLAARLDAVASDLAHGERRRLEIAMALALRPRVFLLDEPMAGLGGEGGAEVTALLSELRTEAPILLVEHDMDAVFALADRISVLVYGRIIATGTVDQIRAHPEVRAAYLGEEAA